MNRITYPDHLAYNIIKLAYTHQSDILTLEIAWNMCFAAMKWCRESNDETQVDWRSIYDELGKNIEALRNDSSATFQRVTLDKEYERISELFAQAEGKLFFVPTINFRRDWRQYTLTGESAEWAGRIMPGQTVHEGIAQELHDALGYDGTFSYGKLELRDTVKDKKGAAIQRYDVAITLRDEPPADISYEEDYDLFSRGWKLQQYLDLFEGAGTWKEIVIYTDLDYDSWAIIVETTTGSVLLQCGDEGDLGPLSEEPSKKQELSNFTIPDDADDDSYVEVSSGNFLSLKDKIGNVEYKYSAKIGHYTYVLTALTLKSYKIINKL